MNTGMWVQATCVVIDLAVASVIEFPGPGGIWRRDRTAPQGGIDGAMIAMIVMSIACAVTMFAQYWLSLIVGGLTKSIIQATRNPLTVLLATIVLRQPCSALTVLGCCVVVCGVALYHHCLNCDAHKPALTEPLEAQPYQGKIESTSTAEPQKEAGNVL